MHTYTHTHHTCHFLLATLPPRDEWIPCFYSNIYRPYGDKVTFSLYSSWTSSQFVLLFFSPKSNPSSSLWLSARLISYEIVIDFSVNLHSKKYNKRLGNNLLISLRCSCFVALGRLIIHSSSVRPLSWSELKPLLGAVDWVWGWNTL